MNLEYILACGVVWRKTADPEAGLDLVEGLESPDLEVRALAHALLVQGGLDSMGLLEQAVSAGVVKPDAAGACMAELLRSPERASLSSVERDTVPLEQFDVAIAPLGRS